MATEGNSQSAKENNKSAENLEYSYITNTKVRRYEPTPRCEGSDARREIPMQAAHSDGSRLPSTYEEFSTGKKQAKAISEQDNVAKFMANKKFFCILVALVLVLLVAIACFIAAFVEVATLKSTSEEASAQLLELTSSSVTDDMTSVMLHLEQLNQSIRSLDNRITAQINQIENTLNTSVQTQSCNFDEQQLQVIKNGVASNLTALLQEISSSLNEASQLNESVSTLYQFFEASTLLLNSYTSQTSISSCAALPPSSPSGYYWVSNSIGSTVSVYCDTTRSCGGITGGWTRVAELDTTSNGHQCPSGLTQRTDGAILTCVRDNSTAGCSSVTFPTEGISYSRVCGRITAYQVGLTDGFHPSTMDIDENYVDGVVLTHSDPRQHIWTFASGLDRTGMTSTGSNCPCQGNSAATPPSFVSNDHFCDSGNPQFTGMSDFYTNPLWDGSDCLCCGTNPPWFHKQLPQPTTDDIEMRVCRDEEKNSATSEDIAIQSVEIYIQ